jgi:hypothetical protein
MTDYTLGADAGGFALGGQAVALGHGYALPIGAGGFALTGEPAPLRAAHRIAAGAGSLTLSGRAVGVAAHRRQAVSAGAFPLAGQPVALLRGYPLAVGAGSFALAGKPVWLHAVSEPEYQAWLRADGVQRVVLVEANYYADGAEQTRYLSNYPYVSGPGDIPANTAYEDILAGVPSFRVGIDLPLAIGDLEVWNENGERDGWLDDSWGGRDVAIFLGDPNWSRNAFRQILAGVIDDITAPAPDRLSLSVRDKKEKLNKEAHIAVWGSGSLAGNPVPIALGECYNIAPQLYNDALLYYGVHGPITSFVQVRNGGWPMATTDNASTGTTALAAEPEGQITCDVLGEPDGISNLYVNTCADIIKLLVLSRGLAPSEIDYGSFDAFNTLNSSAIGLFLEGRRNLVEVIDEILASAGGHWYFDRLGRLKLWRLDAPTGTAVARFDADDVVENGLRILRREPPFKTLKLGQKKNWTVQDKDALLGAVTAEWREKYGSEWLSPPAAATNSGITAAHKNALSPDLIPTLFVDATAEATRRAALYSQPRTVYEAVMFAGPFQLELGNEITLDHPRFGFAGGANAIVIGLEEQPTRNRVRLELWK